ncbi:MAG: hypothetical protein RLZZ269_1154 [Actinomycetota bacterium]
MMDAVGLVASVILGATMCVAAFSKLRTGRAWEAQGAALGAPRIVLPLVPWVELALGALLIVQLAAAAVSIAALVLLGSFSVLLAVNLARGRRPVCACFGEWSTKPLGPGHLVRNAVLEALAVLTLVASVA